MTTATDSRVCECGRRIWLDTSAGLPYPWRNADDGDLHTCRQPMPDADWLKDLHDRLETLGRLLDDEENVPERYDNTARGFLAEMDTRALSDAERVCHRLWLWVKHPTVSEEGYLK